MSSVPIATYLLKRIHQLGVQHIQGVPGDMNLQFLDYVEDMPELTWGKYFLLELLIDHSW
jgi:TPP-dependent 2-oxoacid decarboxylase